MPLPAKGPGRESNTDPTFSTVIRQLVDEVSQTMKAEVARAIQSVAHVQPVLLSVKQAAVYLGRSEQAVQHLIFQKDLPVVRIGRRVHLDRRDLDAWIEKNKY